VRVLTVNGGSSSLKLAVVEDGAVLAAESAGAAPDRLPAGWLEGALSRLPAVEAVGHRIVHGGERFHSATLLDGEVIAALEELAPLAPLHQRPALAAVAAVSARLGSVPAVACFDTAFFADLPPEAATYAVPARWRQQFGVRRYGFHGLSHAWIARRLGEAVTARPLRLVSCHLGAGASLAAIRDGRPLDTTMGFTPAEGLVMATRPGLVDPGALVYLLRNGVGADELDEGIERAGGLAALAGTPDLAAVLAAAAGGDRPPGSPSRSTCTGWRRSPPPWPPPSAASTCSPSPPGWASTPRRCAPAWRSGARSSGSSSTRRRTPPSPAAAPSARRRAPCGSRSSPPASTSRSPPR